MKVNGVLNESYYGHSLDMNDQIASFIGMKEDKLRSIISEHKVSYGRWYNFSDRELLELGFTKNQVARFRRLLRLTTGLFKSTKGESLNMSSPETIASFYMHMKFNEIEEVKVICVDTKMAYICDETLSIGTISNCLMQPREVLLLALKHHASGIFLIHNHPSGNPEPSEADINVTNRVKESCELIGIRFIDHLVIGDGKYCSLVEMGYL